MNAEEKVKAYDEALERAKIHYETTDSVSDMELLELIFPNLRENEDERIRQKFIKLVKMSSEVGGFALHKWEADEMLAWLEKQKAVDVLDEEEREFADNVDSYRKEIDATYQKGYNEGVKATLEKQGEQKPAWSEEDELMFLSTIQGIEMTNGAAQLKIDWLKSLKERVQPKQEWSEEDGCMLGTMEGWLDTLCEYLKDSSSEYIPDVESCINWLKSLKERIGG